MSKLRLGIDVGGTNTDGVILDEQLNCLAKIKVPTTPDIESGIQAAIRALVSDDAVQADNIHYAMLGTTQCTNAIVERKGLCRVGHLRLSLPSGDSLPPLSGWPREWHAFLGEHFYMVHGGYEFDGSEIAPIDEDEIRACCQRMRGQVDSVSIAGVFSTIKADQEQAVAAIVGEMLPGVTISLSHEIGVMGLLERENATILNAALIPIAQRFTRGFANALQHNGLHAKPLFSQNDGTLVDQATIEAYPIVTIACGPTNSLRGGCHLSGLNDCIVVDVGGTTSDLGMLINGYPRESAVSANVGGIATNFRMPDILAVGIGGGTRVRVDNDRVILGPQSVGYELTRRALAFGGDCLTLTDVALKTGRFTWQGEQPVDLSGVDADLCRQVVAELAEQIEQAVDAIKVSEQPVPVVLVGGGSAILSRDIDGASQVVQPEHYEVANAIGVAIGKVGAAVECIASTRGTSRDAVFAELLAQAKQQAVAAGADADSLAVITQSDTPLAYMTDESHHFRIRVSGELR